MSDKGKIVKHHSLLHADRVLAELRKIWPSNWEGWLRCWANGREKGYHLTAIVHTKTQYGQAACVFSEGRSCDGALAVVGSVNEFDFQSGQPNEAIWERNRQYFYDTDGFSQEWEPSMRGRGNKKAAKWIVEMLRAILKDDLAENRRRRQENEKAKKAKAS